MACPPATAAAWLTICKPYTGFKTLMCCTQMVLVMDEVDGMSAGDRGGVQDLIKTIAKSKARLPGIM